MEARIEVTKSPKSAPVAKTIAAPVVGKFLVKFELEDTTGGRRSGTCADKMLWTMEANEITTPGLI